LKFWGSERPVTFTNSKNVLKSCGMVPVYHCNLSTLDKLNGSSGSTFQLLPCDLATIYQGDNGDSRQHAMMWDGVNWKSDCIQAKANCYTKTGSSLGDYAAVIWRHKALQETNVELKEI
jgi:hypothetical protein